MIHKLILKNFKKIKDEIFLFNHFDLIVGANNSGKSTALQALSIWQFCVDQFSLAKKTSGKNGIQVVLPNFTALPLPEFNLLWTDKISMLGNIERKNKIIYIEIDVYWYDAQKIEHNFCVQIRYQSPQSVFAIPKNGWDYFKEKNSLSSFPHIVYVPPYSGLEAHERWLDDGNVRQNVGKAQPGSVLRNLLYRVIDREDIDVNNNSYWKEVRKKIDDWFGVELLLPQYEKGISTEILSEYKSNKKTFDIISGGSGFHQILTLLAFMYGYKGTTTILFDEPDAHLHVNLQRQILNYIELHSQIQFLIATHSEEFIKNVEVTSILSILSGKPTRVQASNTIISAMSVVDNIDVVRTQDNPYILYVEGEDDARILSAWANILGKTEVYQKFYPYFLGGSTKKEMKDKADNHYNALKQIVQHLERAILLDYDSDNNAYHPDTNQYVLNEWKRKNIDNYLLVPDAWKRAVQIEKKQEENDLFLQPYNDAITAFFAEQNLYLPPNSTWKNVKAQIFSVLDGKKLLFENEDSLFKRIKEADNTELKINRLAVASAMTIDELHEDIVLFFDNLTKIIGNKS